MMSELVPVKEFWAFVDDVQERLEDWVLKNKADINYECCGFASNVLYRILVDWKIHERCGYGTVDDTIYISILKVRGITHEVVTIMNFIHDPTHMQFKPPLTTEELTNSWFYNDYSYDCEKIFKSDDILKVCKEIMPEMYS